MQGCETIFCYAPRFCGLSLCHIISRLIWEDSAAGGDLTAGAGTICRLPSLTYLEVENGFQLGLQLD